MCAKKLSPAQEKNLIEESYDDIPYESFSYPNTHPERLATIATLFGLNPPDFHKAKILEIGGAGGGNLIPIAILYPETQSLGVDLSSEQTAHAQREQKAMGLKNIEFRQMDITQKDKDLGKFDYILCHGVFSWAPQTVRDAIFEVCKNNLTPNGLAIISYNVLPGWGAVKSLREMMLFHVRNFTDPAQKIKEAKQFLNFLYENAATGNDTYRQIIDQERQLFNRANDSYLFHDHLESENYQFYLHEFVTMANKHDLAYVGECEASTMFVGNFNEQVRNTIGAINDAVLQEQYIDFLTNRRFRHSIVTSAANGAKINRRVDADMLFEFFLEARYRPETLEPNATGGMKFNTIALVAKTFFETHDRITSIMFKLLADENRPVKFSELAEKLAKAENITKEHAYDLFRLKGVPLILQGFITLRLETVTFAKEISAKPRAFAWARHLAKQKSMGAVTNLKRETVSMQPFPKMLLTFLNGENTIEDVINLLTEAVKNNELKLHKDGKQLTDEKQIRPIVEEHVHIVLPDIAARALLEA